MLDQIDPYLAELKDNFAKGITRPASFRKQQMTNLLKGMKKMRKDLEEAMVEDLGRSKY